MGELARHLLAAQVGVQAWLLCTKRDNLARLLAVQPQRQGVSRFETVTLDCSQPPARMEYAQASVPRKFRRHLVEICAVQLRLQAQRVQIQRLSGEFVEELPYRGRYAPGRSGSIRSIQAAACFAQFCDKVLLIITCKNILIYKYYLLFL